MGGASSSIPIRIPPRLDEKLGTSSLGAEVRAALTRFHAWIGEPRFQLFLFPEYTDHGPEHVNRVLASAEWLVTDEAWPLLTEQDAAVLCLATLLHDAAMHLPGDGFVALLKDVQRPRIELFDTQTWAELFEDFCAEARRWDDRKLYRILGDRTKGPEEQRDLAAIVAGIREKAQDPERWDLGDQKLLGEFLRRHHARLAHEIARFGVPVSAAGAPNLSAIPKDLADLAGLVARSHNLALRETFDYLQKRYAGRVLCLKTHPVFLMVLLRIADYLEMDAERVNEVAQKLHALRSPISQEEWDAHLAVREVRMPDEGDLEAAFVFAVPDDSGTFLKLRNLLAGLQKELDTSWAVLGEVFSRQEELRGLGIRLRRVRSNLDDPQAFLRDQNPSYFPLHAAFDTAGAELLKLLIKPLYGDRPEVGVRELLQNAVDAVRELEQLMADRGDPEMTTISRPDQEADALIEIDYGEDGHTYCTVSDKGIGMTAETVRDYFLKAGASFRTSDAWLKQFAPDGKSKIPRSGRFGLGALAAFLMGDRIEVHSRHVDARVDDGVCFIARLADHQISLRRLRRLTVGTTIQVHLSEQAAKFGAWGITDGTSWFYTKKWDWFSLGSPLVQRKIGQSFLEQRWVDDQRIAGESDDSRDAVALEGLRGLLWDYNQERRHTHNGIAVGLEESSYFLSDLEWGDPSVPVAFPRIDVLEATRQVPLVLTRFEFEEKSPFFADDLLLDVTREYCAFLLALAPDNPVAVLQLNEISRKSRSNFFRSQTDLGPIWCLQEGFSVLHPWHLAAASGSLIRFLDSRLASDPTTHPFVSVLPTFDSQIGSVRFESEALRYLLSRSVSLRLWGSRHLVPPLIQDRFRQFLPLKEARFGPLRSWSRGSLPRTPEALVEGCKRWYRPKYVAFNALPLIEIQLAEFSEPEPASTFSRIWKGILGDPVIPYEPLERERRFPHAFELLGGRIERWRSPNLTGWRREMRDAMEIRAESEGEEFS